MFKSTSRRKENALRFPENYSRPLAASTHLLKFTSMSKLSHIKPKPPHRDSPIRLHQFTFKLMSQQRQELSRQLDATAILLAEELPAPLEASRGRDRTTKPSDSVNLAPRGKADHQHTGGGSPVFPPTFTSPHHLPVRQVGPDLVLGGWGCHNRCHSS